MTSSNLIGEVYMKRDQFIKDNSSQKMTLGWDLKRCTVFIGPERNIESHAERDYQ